MEIVNAADLIVGRELVVRPPRFEGRPSYQATPRLGFMRGGKKHKLPCDFDYVEGIWLVSERLKQAFESVDAEAFAFAACDFTLPDGSRGPQYYLCNVVRVLDALDEEASIMKPPIFERDHSTGEMVKIYDFAGLPSLTFKKSVVGESHIFRPTYMDIVIFCDRFFYEACKNFGMNKKDGIKGLRFRDAADY